MFHNFEIFILPDNFETTDNCDNDIHKILDKRLPVHLNSHSHTLNVHFVITAVRKNKPKNLYERRIKILRKLRFVVKKSVASIPIFSDWLICFATG